MDSSLEQSYRDCLALARDSGSNFYYSFLTLPRDLFRDTCVLYAYMRCTDDLGDAAGQDVTSRRAQLTTWRNQLQAALSGERSTGIWPAVADMVRRRQIPPRLLEEVISGVEQDLRPVRFDTFVDLEAYCYQVAGVVGECCLHIWGSSGPDCSSRAIACGAAFQLTNILRDLGEDADRGRCYLPQDEMRRFGYLWEDLQAHRRNDAFRALMLFQVDRVRAFYREAALLQQNLSPPGRRILQAMLRTYGALLDEIERRDFNVFTSRISLPKWRKWLIVGRSLLPGSYQPTLAGK